MLKIGTNLKKLWKRAMSGKCQMSKLVSRREYSKNSISFILTKRFKTIEYYQCDISQNFQNLLKKL